MGNSFGNLGGMRKRTTKVMKISGESFKLKTPVRAGSVLEKHPGHVLLESESVKHYGVRAKPLEPQQDLKPNRLYFLVELPKMAPEDDKATRRVRSGIQLTAKDRLESLMLARRSASDLYIMKPSASAAPSSSSSSSSFVSSTLGIQSQSQSLQDPTDTGGVRVRMRLPKAEVERLMAESKDGSEVAEKIVGLCMAKGGVAAAAEPPTLNLNVNTNLRRKQAVVDGDEGDEGDDVKRPRIKPREVLAITTSVSSFISTYYLLVHYFYSLSNFYSAFLLDELMFVNLSE